MQFDDNDIILLLTVLSEKLNQFRFADYSANELNWSISTEYSILGLYFRSNFNT